MGLPPDHPSHRRPVRRSAGPWCCSHNRGSDHTGHMRPTSTGLTSQSEPARPGLVCPGSFICRCDAHHALKPATSTSVATTAKIQPPRILLPRAEVDAMRGNVSSCAFAPSFGISDCVLMSGPAVLRPCSRWARPERCNLWRLAVNALTQINPAAPHLAGAVWSPSSFAFIATLPRFG